MEYQLVDCKTGDSPPGGFSHENERSGMATCTLASMQISAVNIVFGGNEFLASQAVRDIRHAAREAMPDADQTDLDARTATDSDLLQAISPTLLAPRSIVVITDLQDADPKFAQGLVEATKTLMERPHDPDAIVICRHNGGQKGKGVVDALVKAGAWREEIPQLDKPQARVNFVRQRFESLGRHIDVRAAQQLASVMGENPGELYAMCEQLCSDFDDEPMTLARVNEYMTGDPQTTGFEVADLAIAGNAPRAIVTMRSAVEQGIVPIAIIGALASKMRTLAKAAAVNAGTITEQEAGVPGWLLSRARGQLRGWTGPGMAACFEALAKADQQCKSNGGDPVYALECAIECIAAKGATQQGMGMANAGMAGNGFAGVGMAGGRTY